MNNIELNKSEIQMIIQTINIPLGAYGYDEFIESTKINVSDLLALIKEFNEADNNYVLKDEHAAEILIKALLKSCEIAGTEYHTLTGFEDLELIELINKIINSKTKL